MKTFILASLVALGVLASRAEVPDMVFYSVTLTYRENGVQKSVSIKPPAREDIVVSGVGTIKFSAYDNTWGNSIGLSVIRGGADYGVFGISDFEESGTRDIGSLLSLWDGQDLGNGIITDVKLSWSVLPVVSSTSYSTLLVGSAGIPLVSSSGNLLYSSRPATMDFQCEWRFGTANPIPRALINGEIVCESHSSSHVIPYSLDKYGSSWSLVDGKWTAEFTLGIVGGASQTVTFRVSSTKIGSAASATSYGWMGATKRFRATVDPNTGEETLTALD